MKYKAKYPMWDGQFVGELMNYFEINNMEVPEILLDDGEIYFKNRYYGLFMDDNDDIQEAPPPLHWFKVDINDNECAGTPFDNDFEAMIWCSKNSTSQWYSKEYGIFEFESGDDAFRFRLCC